MLSTCKWRTSFLQGRVYSMPSSRWPTATKCKAFELRFFFPYFFFSFSLQVICIYYGFEFCVYKGFLCLRIPYVFMFLVLILWLFFFCLLVLFHTDLFALFYLMYLIYYLHDCFPMRDIKGIYPGSMEGGE